MTNFEEFIYNFENKYGIIVLKTVQILYMFNS